MKTISSNIPIPFDSIPTNLEEAERKFKEMYGHQQHGEQIVSCMTEILRMRLKQGEDFRKAYKNTLYDYLRTPESERK